MPILSWERDKSKSKEEQTTEVILMACTNTAFAGAFDPTPGGLDIPVIVATWASMLSEIAEIYKAPFDENTIKISLHSAVKSIGIGGAATKILAWILKWTGAGTVAGILINSTLNAVYTWRVGKLYQKAFKSKKAPTAEDVLDALTGVIPKSEAKTAYERVKED